MDGFAIRAIRVIPLLGEMSRRDKRVAVPARNRPYGVHINRGEAATEIIHYSLFIIH